MAGQWVEDPRDPSGWRWDTAAPAADPSPTSILSAYAGRPAPMPRDELAVPRTVYDPRLGRDGGARYADPDPIPAIDPDRPVAHVDELGPDDGPAYWIGPDPEADYFDGRDTVAREPVCCETCGSYVHPDRLRG